MTSTEVLLVKELGVASIILDGPETRNALDDASVEAIIQACDEIDADPTIGAAVITGVSSSFCSGAHTSLLDGLKEKGEPEVRKGLGRIYEAFTRVKQLKVPTLAVVNGSAVGAGVNLALVCDLRICTPDAFFASGFAKLGIHPGGGHFNLISHQTNNSVAAAMGLFAQKVDSKKALEIGLVWEVIESAKIREAIHGYTSHLGADPSLARALALSLRETSQPSVDWLASLDIERNRQVWTFTRGKE